MNDNNQNSQNTNINSVNVNQTNYQPTAPVQQVVDNSNVVQMPANNTQNVAPSTMPSSQVQNINPTPMQNSEINSFDNSELPPIANQEEIKVIDATRSKTSNIILVIIVILLIAFVFNMDKVIEYYETYMSTGSLTTTNKSKSGDNLSNGFILLDDNSSSKNLKDIKFYNFRKSGDNLITFNYESNVKYSDSSILGIYVELYNSDKEIIYKELFDIKTVLEKDTVKIYSLEVDSNIYEDAFYALVKTYSDVEEKSQTTLVCTLEDDKGKYSITYNFLNNVLSSYNVSKESKTDDNTELLDEYNSIKDLFNSSYENNKLAYTVDLSKDYSDYKVLYNNKATLVVIKSKEELKKWTCK